MYQASRDIFAAATGFYCTENLCDTKGDEELEIEATPFNSASKILEAKEPEFSTVILDQSTSDPGASATITVTLKTNKALSGSDAKITFTGLCGTTLNQDVKILDMFGSPINAHSSPSIKIFKSSALWLKDDKVLKLGLGVDGLSAGTTYVFKFVWELVEEANDACPVTIKATSTSRVLI